MAELPAAPRQIRFRCPHCGKVNKAAINCIGRGGTCVKCGGGVKVPGASGRVAASAKQSIDSNKALQPSAAPFFICDDELIAREDRVSVLEDLIVGRTSNDFAQPVKSESAFPEELHAHLSTPSARTYIKRSPSGSAWWIWALHLSLPIATAWILFSIYDARRPTTRIEWTREVAHVDPSSTQVASPTRTPQTQSGESEFETWDEHEIRIDADGSRTFVIRHCQAAAAEARTYTEQRFAEAPPDFPTDAPVFDDGERVFALSVDGVALTGVEPIVEVPPVASSVEQEVGEGFAALRGGDIKRAEAAFRARPSIRSDAGLALIDCSDNAMELAVSRAKAEDARIVTLCAAKLFLENRPLRSAQVAHAYLRTINSRDDTVYLALGTALERIAKRSTEKRAAGVATLRKTLATSAQAIKKEDGGTTFMRFGNAWLEESEAKASWAALEALLAQVETASATMQDKLASVDDLRTRLKALEISLLARHLKADQDAWYRHLRTALPTLEHAAVDADQAYRDVKSRLQQSRQPHYADQIEFP